MSVMQHPGCVQAVGKGRTLTRCPRRGRQCEAANARAREYIGELRANRINFLWHKDPPPDACALPPEGLPWRPTFEEWD
jgi:hypothetical protein